MYLMNLDSTALNLTIWSEKVLACNATVPIVMGINISSAVGLQKMFSIRCIREFVITACHQPQTFLHIFYQRQNGTNDYSVYWPL